MPNIFKDWDSEVNVADLHAAHQARKVTIQYVAKRVAERLKNNKYHDDEDLKDIIAQFDEIAESDSRDQATAVVEYDSALRELYDWGDTDKRIWVNSLENFLKKESQNV